MKGNAQSQWFVGRYTIKVSKNLIRHIFNAIKVIEKNLNVLKSIEKSCKRTFFNHDKYIQIMLELNGTKYNFTRSKYWVKFFMLWNLCSSR